MAKAATTLLGLCIAGATSLALPVSLEVTSGQEDLAVKVSAPRRFELLVSSGEPRALTQVIPLDAEGGQAFPLRQPGLFLTTWRRTYGRGYLREVTWPSLVGPFLPNGGEVCGYSLHLGAGLFDSSRAGNGLARVIRRELVGHLPPDIKGIPLPEVQDVRFRAKPRPGWIQIHLGVSLVGGTEFSVDFDARLVSVKGALVLEMSRDTASVDFKGELYQKLVNKVWGATVLVCGFDYLFEPERCVRDKAREFVIEELSKVLPDLDLGTKLTRPFPPVASRPGDEVRIRFDGPPTVTQTGITLPLCIRIKAGEPVNDSAVPGGIDLAANRLLQPSAEPTGNQIGLSMNADALNQIVYYLWQSGLLRELGRSGIVFDALSDRVRAAAFDFTGLDPRLPPTLTPSGAGSQSLPFVLGDVTLGTMTGRTVIAHGSADLAFAQSGDDIQLRGQVRDVRLNCVEVEGGKVKLSPCLGDLLPVAREMAAKKPITQTFAGANLLGKLPQVGFQQVQVRLSDLRVEAAGSPPGVHLSVRARFE